ncbi:MAG TPA: lysophospholipid acyltransferase family protein [Rhizomicrobium sp.]|jgi:1-acyl-sn-glycerol-3-phosphate acyltransferase|nr:lysophospholipid acyltransferase family protein [Rhizomicrobium sp.]
MAWLRAVIIIAAFLVLTLALMPVQWLFLKLGSRAARTFPNRYHRLVAALFGIHIRVVGKPVTSEGVLMVANHTSWADIVIFSAVTPLSFVSKAEVGGWPLFGTLARLQRTVFVERARRSATGETRDEIRERLLAGDTLLLFPEGTSHDGNRVLPFKSALLGAAEAVLANGQHVKVQPVSAAFTGLYGLPMGRENRPLFAWYGDMEMLPHLWEALKAGPLDVVVQFHPPFSLDAMDRKTLAKKAQDVVQAGVSQALAGHA